MHRAKKGAGEEPGSVRSHVHTEGGGLSACYPDSRTVTYSLPGSFHFSPTRLIYFLIFNFYFYFLICDGLYWKPATRN